MSVNLSALGSTNLVRLWAEQSKKCFSTFYPPLWSSCTLLVLPLHVSPLCLVLHIPLSSIFVKSFCSFLSISLCSCLTSYSSLLTTLFTLRVSTCFSVWILWCPPFWTSFCLLLCCPLLLFLPCYLHFVAQTYFMMLLWYYIYHRVSEKSKSSWSLGWPKDVMLLNVTLITGVHFGFVLTLAYGIIEFSTYSRIVWS